MLEFDEENFPYPPGTGDDDDSKKAKWLEILLKCAVEGANFDGYSGGVPECMCNAYTIYVGIFCVCQKMSKQTPIKI
mgnify:CR=1 FL=1